MDSSILELMKEVDERRRKKPWWNKLFWKFNDFRLWVRHDIHQGIKGLIYWAPFAWKWRSWDYEWGLLALKLHLIKLENTCRNGYSVDGFKSADGIKKAIFLINRIVEDNYFISERPDCLSEKAAIINNGLAKQRDLKELTRILNKNLLKWWD